MTAFLFIIFLAHGNGTITTHAEMVTGADLCLSKQEETIADMQARGLDPNTYSVQCIDTKLYRRMTDGV